MQFIGKNMTKKAKFENLMMKTSDLIPYARNSRTHSDDQVAQIAGSISEFGFTNPVLIDPDNGIIAGHGRVMAAGKLGIKEVPCIRVTGWTDAQKKAYIITDNQLPLNAGWDLEMLRIEIQDLAEMDFDIDLLGFDDSYISKLMDDISDDREELLEKLSNERYAVLIDASSEYEQQKLFDEFQGRGLQCKLIS